MRFPAFPVLALSLALSFGCGGGVEPANCTSGYTACGKSCVDVTTDIKHCGVCGTACAGFQACADGVCTGTCDAPQTACPAQNPTACVNTQADAGNCGGCGMVCAGGMVCLSGTCGCPGTLTDCGGTCINTATSDANCGACAMACASGLLCASGTCVTSCPSSTPTQCGSGATAYCANTTNDPYDCSACGTACPNEQQCSNGACACPTTAPDACSTGANAVCTRLESDPANCGTCGKVCATGQMCSSGECTCPTAAKPDACGAVCTNLQTDHGNCGTCGKACPNGMICATGTCQSSCPASMSTPCGSGSTAYCADTTSDASNCGGCGTACADGAACAGSACVCPTGQTTCGGDASGPGICVLTGQCLSGALPTDCSALRLLSPALGSGAYTIDPDGVSGPIAPFPVYCDMAADGGGWTLALKADGTSNNPSAAQFRYGSSVWTTASPTDPNYAFNTASPDVTTRMSAKYMSFNTLPYTQVRLGMSDLTSVQYVQFSLPGPAAYTTGATGKVSQSSLRATFAAGTTIMAGQAGIPAQNAIGAAMLTAQNGPPAGAGTPTRAEWLALTSVSYLQPSCNFGGLNVDPTAGTVGNARTRVGVVGNDQGDCTSPDSYMGLGNDGATCGRATYYVGNSAGCVPDGMNGAVGAFAYLYVRNTDFRNVVPAKASCAAHLAAGYAISGIYPITYGSVSNAVYCDMTHGGGGWTMVYKFSSGLPQTDDANASWTGGPQNEGVPAQLNVMSAPGTPTGPYLSRIVSTDWSTTGGFAVGKTRVVVYNGEEEAQSLQFTIPSGTNISTWFTAANLASSTWADVTTAATYDFFSILGDTNSTGGRRWLVNRSSIDCTTDAGWLAVTFNGTPGLPLGDAVVDRAPPHHQHRRSGPDPLRQPDHRSGLADHHREGGPRHGDCGVRAVTFTRRRSRGRASLPVRAWQRSETARAPRTRRDRGGAILPACAAPRRPVR